MPLLPTHTTAPDPLLLRYFEALSAADEAAALDELISREASPVIELVIRRKLHVRMSGEGEREQDAQELATDVRVAAIRRLRLLKQDRHVPAPANFRAYVHALAEHVCADYLRVRFPERTRLKRRIRHIASEAPELVVAEGSVRLVVAPSPAPDSRELPRWEENPRVLLATLVARSGGTATLDDLTTAVAEHAGIESGEVSERQVEADAVAETLAAPAPSAAVVVEQRDLLSRIWAEILLLPRNQRVALLLNLRDPEGGGSPLLFLPVFAIASLVAIAAALEVPPRELARIWHALPLDDAQIGVMLGVPRQQVINLRKSARDRLSRRDRQWHKSGGNLRHR